MANRDQKNVNPEQLVAKLLLKRTKLQPPVPVYDLLSAHAEIEQVPIPGTVDGFVLWPPHSKRPRVFLNSAKRNENRKRFTVAHELGHILLPWQIGSVFCHTEEDVGGDQTYRDIEMEANRFAGELLVPTDWCRSVLRCLQGDLARRIIEIGNLAEASAMVAAFTVAKVKETAMIFVTRNDTTVMNVFGPVLGSYGRRQWSPDLIKSYAQLGGQHCDSNYGDYAIHCIEFPSSPIKRRPAQSATGMLEEIVYSVTRIQKERESLLCRVNGIIGSANTMISATTPRDILVALRLRFANRPALKSVLRHPRFEKYLLARAYNLAERKK